MDSKKKSHVIVLRGSRRGRWGRGWGQRGRWALGVLRASEVGAELFANLNVFRQDFWVQKSRLVDSAERSTIDH